MGSRKSGKCWKFILKFSSNFLFINWTQPSPLDATACSGLSISSGTVNSRTSSVNRGHARYAQALFNFVQYKWKWRAMTSYDEQVSTDGRTNWTNSEYGHHGTCYQERVQAWGCISNATAYHKQGDDGRCAMWFQAFFHTTQVYQA